MCVCVYIYTWTIDANEALLCSLGFFAAVTGAAATSTATISIRSADRENRLERQAARLPRWKQFASPRSMIGNL